MEGLKTLGVLALIAFAALGYRIYSAMRFEGSSVRVSGEVIGFTEDQRIVHDTGKDTWRRGGVPVVGFEMPDGARYRTPIAESGFKWFYREGPVELAVSPADPYEVRIVGAYANKVNLSLGMIGTVFALLGVAKTIADLKHRYRQS